MHSRVDIERCVISAVALGALGTAVAIGGCAKSKPDSGAPEPSASSSSAVAIPSPSSSSSSPSGGVAPSGSAPTYALALADRLTREATTRPAVAPKAEDVFAAIVKAGIPLDPPEQHLASPIGARYCLGATSPAPQNLKMSACEYADDAAANAGRTMSLKAFASIPKRDVTVNHKTTLTILQSPADAGSQAAHDKAVAAFAKL
jgi:hypothetical protein